MWSPRAQQHRHVAILKRLLNRFNAPRDHVPIDDRVDETTHRAVHKFRVTWYHRVSDRVAGRLDAINPQLWRMLGKVLHMQNALLPYLRTTKVHEVRSLLLGHSPHNAVEPFYSARLEAIDEKLARLFGGPKAVAAGVGFEPDSLAIVQGNASRFSYYRGETKQEKGLGHLAGYAMHMYGSTDGTRFGVTGNAPADLYVPDGYTHAQGPGPTDAGMSFYYRTLGPLRDVTYIVVHVLNPQRTKVGTRWRIGGIGGKNGETTTYRHAHMQLAKGNVGLGGKRHTIPFASLFPNT